jgi:hypothetical protein
MAVKMKGENDNEASLIRRPAWHGEYRKIGARRARICLFARCTPHHIGARRCNARKSRMRAWRRPSMAKEGWKSEKRRNGEEKRRSIRREKA